MTLCRDATDPRQPCRYALDGSHGTACHSSRQQVAQQWNVNGKRCVFYEMRELDQTYPGTPRSPDA